MLLWCPCPNTLTYLLYLTLCLNWHGLVTPRPRTSWHSVNILQLLCPCSLHVEVALGKILDPITVTGEYVPGTYSEMMSRWHCSLWHQYECVGESAVKGFEWAIRLEKKNAVHLPFTVNVHCWLAVGCWGQQSSSHIQGEDLLNLLYFAFSSVKQLLVQLYELLKLSSYWRKPASFHLLISKRNAQ